jgi:hypothetical protein
MATAQPTVQQQIGFIVSPFDITNYGDVAFCKAGVPTGLFRRRESTAEFEVHQPLAHELMTK